jgi:hypothetical protein
MEEEEFMLSLNSMSRRTKLLLVVGGGFLLVILLAIILATHKSKPKDVGTGLNYYDPRSGETISDPLGKTKDSYGSIPDVPSVLGISKLTAYGLSQQQLGFTQDAFTKFARSQNPKVNLISIDVSSIKHLTANPQEQNSRNTLSFNIQLDRQKLLDARLEFFGLKEIRLVLFNAGKRVFDSGDLGNTSQAVPNND